MKVRHSVVAIAATCATVIGVGARVEVARQQRQPGLQAPAQNDGEPGALGPSGGAEGAV